MTAMTVRLGCPLLQSLLFKVYEEGRFCPSGDSDDSGDGNVGIPFHCHPAGEHPVNAKCRRGIYSPFSRLIKPPLRQKNPKIFPTAFTGCNTLHLAGKERVPDVPSGLPYGGRARPAYPPLFASDTRMMWVTVTAQRSIPKPLSSLSPLSPKESLPAERKEESAMPYPRLCGGEVLFRLLQESAEGEIQREQAQEQGAKQAGMY